MCIVYHYSGVFFSHISVDFGTRKQESTSAAVESIADAVTHARFVGTDPESDEVVLMKILQVTSGNSVC